MAVNGPTSTGAHGSKVLTTGILGRAVLDLYHCVCTQFRVWAMHANLTVAVGRQGFTSTADRKV